jgi:hypothetical protein
MRKIINVQIPDPCHEDWNKMTPKDKGRHCNTCNKTVIDFTKQTDEQIIKSLESIGNLCGRFKKQQLNRDIVLARKVKNNYLSWAASGLFAFLAFSNQDISAQGEPNKTELIVKPLVKGKVATSILNEQIYFGTVKTAIDGLPLPGASITLKGTSRKVQTDFDGNFTIKGKLSDKIEISYFGMISQELILNTNNIINIDLKDNECIENYVVAGYVKYSNNNFNKCRKKQLRKENKAKRIIKRKSIKDGELKRTYLGKFLYGIKRLFHKK